MLETKLEELKNELSELRAVMADLTKAMRAAPAPAPAPAPAAAVVEAKPESTATLIKAELAKADPENINRDDLQDLCMTIVRNDRAKKTAVKDAIAAFGGAATLKDVPESDLVALKAALDALV